MKNILKALMNKAKAKAKNNKPAEAKAKPAKANAKPAKAKPAKATPAKRKPVDVVKGIRKNFTVPQQKRILELLQKALAAPNPYGKNNLRG